MLRPLRPHQFGWKTSLRREYGASLEFVASRDPTLLMRYLSLASNPIWFSLECNYCSMQSTLPRSRVTLLPCSTTRSNVLHASSSSTPSIQTMRLARPIYHWATLRTVLLITQSRHGRCVAFVLRFVASDHRRRGSNASAHLPHWSVFHRTLQHTLLLRRCHGLGDSLSSSPRLLVFRFPAHVTRFSHPFLLSPQ